MRTFREYVEYREIFEFSPVAPTAALITILRKLDHETIVEFAYEVANDVKDFAKDNEQCSSAITECLSAVKAWLDNPEAREEITTRLHAAAHAARTAARAATFAASYAAAFAASYAAAFAATYADHADYSAAYDAYTTADHAANAATAVVVDPNKREAVRQTYMNKYKQWAYNYSSREVTPTHDNQQLYAELSSFAQDPKGTSVGLTNIILDFLYEHEMEIGNDVLKYFGVKSFGNRNQMAEEIHKYPRNVERFYHIVRTLAERKGN